MSVDWQLMFTKETLNQRDPYSLWSNIWLRFKSARTGEARLTGCPNRNITIVNKIFQKNRIAFDDSFAEQITVKRMKNSDEGRNFISCSSRLFSGIFPHEYESYNLAWGWSYARAIC